MIAPTIPPPPGAALARPLGQPAAAPWLHPAPPAAPSRRPRWPLVVLIVAVVGSVLTQVGPGAALLVGFAVAVPIERIWRRHDFGVRRPGLRTDAFHVLFTGALQTAALVVAVVLCAVALFPVLDNPVSRTFQSMPGWAQAVGGLVAFELFGYWYHRLSHEVGFLWRFHGVHHSSERLDWIAAARLHPLEGFFGGLLIGPPLLLLGVGPTTLGALGVITQLWAITLHMNVRWRMRALDGIWGTPEYHHWHHSKHPEAINTNYSGLLPILDIAFGTYYMPKDRRPQVYGIDDPMPEGYLAQLAQPFRRRRPRADAAGPTGPFGPPAVPGAPVAPAPAGAPGPFVHTGPPSPGPWVLSWPGPAPVSAVPVGPVPVGPAAVGPPAGPARVGPVPVERGPASPTAWIASTTPLPVPWAPPG